MAATYKDIQKMTGLSLSTISNYFNGISVRDKNRKAIEQAIDKLDFRINEYARGLKSRKSRTVGLLIPELNSTFHTTIMGEVCDVLRTKGYSAIVCDCHQKKEVEREALTFLLDKMVDGVITIPLDKTGKHLQLAAERGIPVVLVDRLVTDFKTDAVLLDNTGAGALAAQEFVQKGHRNIGMICGEQAIYTMRNRRLGFTEYLEKHDITPCEDWLICTEFSMDGGYQAAKRMLSGASRPTALFTANYELTLGAVMAINELGIRIPEDVSLIGFDNLPLAQIVKPRLTMIVQPMRDFAVCAADIMLRRLSDDPPRGNQIIELSAQMVPGNSVLQL